MSLDDIVHNGLKSIYHLISEGKSYFENDELAHLFIGTGVYFSCSRLLKKVTKYNKEVSLLGLISLETINEYIDFYARNNNIALSDTIKDYVFTLGLPLFLYSIDKYNTYKLNRKLK
jgi:hypothetical protein